MHSLKCDDDSFMDTLHSPYKRGQQQKIKRKETSSSIFCFSPLRDSIRWGQRRTFIKRSWENKKTRRKKEKFNQSLDWMAWFFFFLMFRRSIGRVEDSDHRRKNLPTDFGRSRAKLPELVLKFVFKRSVSRSVGNRSSPIRFENRTLQSSSKFFSDRTPINFDRNRTKLLESTVVFIPIFLHGAVAVAVLQLIVYLLLSGRRLRVRAHHLLVREQI